ncbi:MAG TPA: cupin domain-containing protein [Gemmatimonadales bacterium]|nr:cupin domain-containing protein [Gemmatimonadales bacterium]
MRSLLTITTMGVLLACQPRTPDGDPELKYPRASVIGAEQGERRFLRGGTSPLLIKVDPVTTGSRRMVLASSDLPPGDEIQVHRHLGEDEIIVVTRGTARVQLGKEQHTAGPGSTVFIPQGTCIALANIGRDTFSMFFVFSSPGFERVLREVSSLPGAPVRRLTPEKRAAAFQRGHAEAGPTHC